MSAVITGVGVVSSLGCGADAFAAALASGARGVAPHEFTRLGGGKVTAPAFMAVTPDAKGLIEPRKLRRMDRLIRMAAVSARQALNMAGLDPANFDSSRLGVVFGTAFGALKTTQEFVDSWLKNGERAASPLSFMSSVHGILASQVALDVNATGINLTLAQRDISFEAALATALDLLEENKADALLVGGADELTDVLYELAGHLGHHETLGDGGAVLLLEREGTPRKALARVEHASVGRWDCGAPQLDLANVDAVSVAHAPKSVPAREGALSSFRGSRFCHRTQFGEFATAGALQAAANVLALSDRKAKCILHDAASATGVHASYVMSAV